MLILSIVLLAAGLSSLLAGFLAPNNETLTLTTVDTTTKGSYSSNKFRAEVGYWLVLDLSSSGPSTLRVVGQSAGEIFKIDGTTYKYTVTITAGDVYQVIVDNKAGHYEFFIFWTVDDNHYLGNLYLKATPSYLFPLKTMGEVLPIVGGLFIVGSVLLEYETRRRAKSVYGCPRCGKMVGTGLSTCPYCKIDLTKYWIRCKYCGKLYDSHLEKCPKCGAEA